MDSSFSSTSTRSSRGRSINPNPKFFNGTFQTAKKKSRDVKPNVAKKVIAKKVLPVPTKLRRSMIPIKKNPSKTFPKVPKRCLEICADEKKTSDYWEVIEDPTKTKSEKDLMPTSQIHPGFQVIRINLINQQELEIIMQRIFEFLVSSWSTIYEFCYNSYSQIHAKYTSLLQRFNLK